MRSLFIVFAASIVACGPEARDTAASSTTLNARAGRSQTLAIPGGVPFPEGVAADARGTLYVGSLTTGAIARFGRRGRTSAIWLPSGVLERGAIGLTVDRRRRVLWVCDSSTFEPVASSLVGIDIKSRRVVARHPLPASGPVLCNDVSVSPRGDIFLSDSFGGRVLRVAAADALTDAPAVEWSTSDLLVAPSDPPFGANGIVATRRAVFVVNFNTGTLIRIPIRRSRVAGVAAVVPLFDGDDQPTRIFGPDGLARSGFAELLVVENGVFGGPNRLTRISLDLKDGRLVGHLEPIADGLNVPTTVAVVKNVAWVVEGQLDHFLGLDPSPPDPFQLVAVEIDR